MGGQNQLVYLPTTLAQELGYYKEEGLDVEIQDYAGGAKALQSLVGGSSDVVSGFYDHTIQMAAEGRAFVAFVNMLRYPGLVLVTSPQSAGAVTKIGDLKGRIAGVTAAGSSSQMLLTYMLQRSGLTLEDGQHHARGQRRHGNRGDRARQGGRRDGGGPGIHDHHDAQSRRAGAGGSAHRGRRQGGSRRRHLSQLRSVREGRMDSRQPRDDVEAGPRDSAHAAVDAHALAAARSPPRRRRHSAAKTMPSTSTP